MRDAFLREHERVYGYAAPDEPVQFVALRLTAFGDHELPPSPALPRAASDDPKEARIGERAVYFEEMREFQTTPVYRRERLRAGPPRAGPGHRRADGLDHRHPHRSGGAVDERANLIVQVGSA